MRLRALLFACLVPAVAIADEQPTQHVVKAGDTCGSIAQHYYGDSRFADLLHAANPELAKKPVPHILVPGMILVLPPKPGPKTGPDAQLTAVRNQVEVQTPDPKPGKPNDPLFRGNRVSTEASSAADVTFRDETQVRLGERTLVIILGDARSEAQKITSADENQTTLVTGNLRAFMPGYKKDAPVATVTTPGAAVKVFSGQAQVSADAVKTTRIAVYGGSSTIDARGKTREVARGFGSKADLGQPPTPPKPLPPAPIWSSMPGLVLFDQGKESIVGEYDVPPSDHHIASWRVQIARDGIFRDVAIDTTVPSEIRRLEATPPGAGRYYIRVSAIDDDHFEGPFGYIARVLVVQAKTTALPESHRRIELSPSDAFCVRVGNVALTRIESAFVTGANEPVRLRCAPSESDPTTLISLD